MEKRTACSLGVIAHALPMAVMEAAASSVAAQAVIGLDGTSHSLNAHFRLQSIHGCKTSDTYDERSFGTLVFGMYDANPCGSTSTCSLDVCGGLDCISGKQNVGLVDVQVAVVAHGLIQAVPMIHIVTIG